MKSIRFSFFVLFLCLIHMKCNARDVISPENVLASNTEETVVSDGNIFELGFFNITPDDGSNVINTYVGIWYKVSPATVVWVANRDNPINTTMPDEFVAIAIDSDGNLKVQDTMSNSYFSTQVFTGSNNRRAKLLDTGNLILIDDVSRKTVWQSFAYPTDTFLPGMKMEEGFKLTSWRVSLKDPGTGNYTFQLSESNEYTISQRTIVRWKNTAKTAWLSFNEVPSVVESMLSNSTKPSNFSSSINISYLFMNSSGEIQFYSWDGETSRWFVSWVVPQGPCGVYDACGKFGVCNSNTRTSCKCLPGFKPESPDDWNAGIYVDGCSRKSESSCSSRKKKSDTFVTIPSMKFQQPDSHYSEAYSDADCKNECLGNCQCIAYSYSEKQDETRKAGTSRSPNSNSGCFIWTSDLNDLRGDYPGGYNLSLRLAVADTALQNTTQGIQSVEKSSSNNHKALIISLSITAAIITMCITGYLICHCNKMKRRKAKEIILGKRMGFSRSSSKHLLTEDDKKQIDVPYFNLKSILIATENFSDANMLGRGGFGPVYKGKFPEGQEMAVKRLSSHSGQGAEEFKNEVILIAKLQHRNLVRLLGYCVEADEKILLYEYMPNKSLDTFIFDGNMRHLLDWKIRFDIILGIARGLLYLHHDSRLRIIHRDLKTSNILLDEELNAKISDFGLARIVEGKSIEASTQKVVGTYGYLSPEYALEGLFSIKSDVFAFGVVVLEIISGKRNLQLFEAKNLMSDTWSLWMEDKALEIMDPTLAETCNKEEVWRCINIALLCVQEYSGDRPTMTNVVIMLGSDSAGLPCPNQPAFITRRNTSSTSSSSSYKPHTSFNNEFTVSLQDGR